MPRPIENREDVMKTKCECWTRGDKVIFCPLHASAGEMLKMLVTVHRDGAGIHYEAIAKLIARAEGKETP